MVTEKLTTLVELDKANYKTKIYSNNHFIYADEPESVGGTDEGMQPASLLMASLGSCTAITVRMYADRKGYALEHIKIELTYEVANNETFIDKKIEFIGELSDEERKRLMVIADKCPIHKILTNPIKIQSTLKK